MPDMTMCMGGKCPVRAKCYRHRAVPSEYWQAWFVKVPFDTYPDTRIETFEGDQACPHFQRIMDGDRLREVRE